MPRLRCLAGPSPDELYPISVNSSKAHHISSDLFEGRVAVFIKLEESRDEYCSEEDVHDYFRRPDRKGVTWSIQVQGRFLKNFKADDIVFGNTFDRPLQLPWGSGAVLKFMSIIDPTMEHDLAGPQPWALSPLISTMPYFHHQRRISGSPPIPFPGHDSLTDNVENMRSTKKIPEKVSQSSHGRRAWFSNAKNRQDVTFGPNDLITTDFCYGFLKFPQLHLVLPAGISFDLKKYWDGQPVRFVCCERHPDGFQEAKSFWCVVFEIIDEDDDLGLEESEKSFASVP